MEQSMASSDCAYCPNENVLALVERISVEILGDQVICRKTLNEALSLGNDLEGRGLHWHLIGETGPEYRLALSLAVYCKGGTYAIVGPGTVVLCVKQVATAYLTLKRHMGHCPYRAGHAAALLHIALQYIGEATDVFEAFVPPSLARCAGFAKGFADALNQMQVRTQRGGIGTGHECSSLLSNAFMHYRCSN